MYATLGTCYSVWMTVWYAGAPCIPDSHLHRITSTKGCIHTVVPPDDWPCVALKMWRLITILRINYATSGFYLQNYTEMHSQQNIENGPNCSSDL